MSLVDSTTGETITLSGTHPVAEMFPMLPADELQALADDVAAQGLLQDVVVDGDGQLLDGRNRLAAAKKAKLNTVPCTVYTGDPVAYILGANMARRDMNKGQKAIILAKALADLDSKSRNDLVAEAGGISAPTLSQAKTILSHAPELADQIVTRKRTLDDAYKVARANKAAATNAEARLEQLATDDPDLAEKVAAGTLTLAEAITLHDRNVREAEQAAKDRTRLFADCVVNLGATLDVGDPTKAVDQLIAEWRADAVHLPDPADWLTADGLNRVARCLILTAERWDNRA